MLRPLFRIRQAFGPQDSKTRLCVIKDDTVYVLSSYAMGAATCTPVPSCKIHLNVPTKNPGTSSFLYECTYDGAIVDPSFICGYIEV